MDAWKYEKYGLGLPGPGSYEPKRVMGTGIRSGFGSSSKLPDVKPWTRETYAIPAQVPLAPSYIVKQYK